MVKPDYLGLINWRLTISAEKDMSKASTPQTARWSVTAWAVLLGVIILVMFAANTGISVLVAHNQEQQYQTLVQNSDDQWCHLLDTLTASPVPKPADPTANPSREETYVFYTELVRLRLNFGCH
jgi:hypothetical protein